MLKNDVPAFPRSYVADGHNGMTLRDWFAGQALTTALVTYRPYNSDFREVAEQAYRVADAMLAERTKPIT